MDFEKEIERITESLRFIAIDDRISPYDDTKRKTRRSVSAEEGAGAKAPTRFLDLDSLTSPDDVKKESTLSEEAAEAAAEPPPPVLPEVTNENALLIEQILDIIFGFITKKPMSEEAAKDVQSVRQVCKTWNDSMTRIFRRTRDPIGFGIGPTFNQSVGRMQQFVDTMKNSQIIPVQSFEIHDKFFAYNGSFQVLKEFLQVCGPEIVSLEFRCLNLEVDLCSRVTEEHFEEWSLDGVEEWSKLKKLIFRVGKLCSTSQSHAFANVLRVLLKKASELEKFRFTLDNDQPSHLRQPFKGIKKLIPKSVKF